MDEGLRLLCDELAHFGVAVSKRIDSYTSSEIKVSAVFNVPEVTALTLCHDGRRADISCNHIGRVGGG